MLNNSEIKEKLEEMIKSKKADNSTLETINNSEIEIKKIQKNLGLLNEDLEKIADEIEQLKLEKSQIAIFKVKDIAIKIKEISEQKKKFKTRLDEISYLNEVCEEKLKLISEINKEVKRQYTVYQENEIFMKAIEKITENNIELSTEFYAGYINQMNKYMNSVYSIEHNTKLEEPNHNDLATLLAILQKNEEKLKKVEEKVVEEEKKTRSRKKSTKTVDEKNDVEPKKKTTRRKSTKKEDEETSSEDVKKKTTTRKRTTKSKATDESDKNDTDSITSEEKVAKTTRKKATKTEKVSDKLENLENGEVVAKEKKTRSRKKVEEPKILEEVHEEAVTEETANQQFFLKNN